MVINMNMIMATTTMITTTMPMPMMIMMIMMMTTTTATTMMIKIDRDGSIILTFDLKNNVVDYEVPSTLIRFSFFNQSCLSI